MMSALSHLKLGLAAVGVIVWAYAARTDSRILSWVGIGFLVAAFLLRFWERRRSDERPADGEGDG